MPDLDLGTQVFDLVFSPTHDIVFAGLLTGHVKALSYNDDGTCEPKFAVRTSKKTARSLAISPDGLELYSVSKDKSIHFGTLGNSPPFDPTPIIKTSSPTSYGWTTRSISLPPGSPHLTPAVTHSTHWLQSGDGTLSVLDIRSNKTTPFAQSEDQEDELLSAVSIKGGAKIAVGTQTGVISIWNRSSGYGDCVDRVPGHPHSVDALAALTPDVIVTGSSDGLVRVVQLLPHKLLGVIADHGTFPIECLKTDRNGAWLGSASHDNVLKMTDVRDALVDSDEEGEEGEKASDDESEVKGKGKGGVDEDSSEDEREQEAGGDEGEVVAVPDQGPNSGPGEEEEPEQGPVAPVHAAQSNDESVPEQPEKQSRKRKKKQGVSGGESKKGKVDEDFFSEL
ncbi:WD repeat-containing protein jip5 [Ceratobasidium sp. 414]|nr:WD repeat-containing protein jip5 [Ceratobasidium sp. 414]